ncbi:hypothetical protein EBZ80_13000 [bacterium]|nr:hypothetical protein [bacterium]
MPAPALEAPALEAPAPAKGKKKDAPEVELYKLLMEHGPALTLLNEQAFQLWKGAKGCSLRLSKVNFAEFAKLFPRRREGLGRIVKLAKILNRTGWNVSTITLRPSGAGAIFFKTA